MIVEQTLPAVAVTTPLEVTHSSGANLLDKIKTRRKKLAKVAKDLKSSFIGLDNIIDEIIRNLEVWYVMPEVITRPVIINLWGMTGVGKTDLVRKLVRHLEMTDKFLEIQLCNNGSAVGGYGTLSGQLGCSNLEPKQPGLLLLDEIQRFRTIDEAGKEITDYKFQDVWMLLSDGKFSGSTDKDDIMRVVFEHVYYSIPNEDAVAPKSNSNKKKKKTDEETATERKHKYRQSYYSAKFLRKALRISNPIEEIMLWDNEKKISMAFERMDDQSTYEGDDYSKLLIFVSGNLDEAYRMSGDTSNANKDADVWHAFSKKINIITIKDALEKRFKPEQISRFGNTHIIYPSLSKASYEGIIASRLRDIVDKVSSEHNIQITVDTTINDFIYRNGVFPSQGVRPLFSTISSYIENSMPLVVLSAIEHGDSRVTVRWEKHELVGTGLNFVVRTKCEGVIDTIKEENEYDKRVNTSVHEAGHCVAYAKLLGLIPTQIISNSSSISSAGFIGIHSIITTTNTIMDMLTVYMAGQAAEEIVFGKNQFTNGASGDIGAATSLISQAYRDWGMFTNITRVENEHLPNAKFSNNNNTQELNDSMEKTVHGQRQVAKELLTNELPLLKELSQYLIEKGKIEPVDLKSMCARHGIVADVLDPKASVYPAYGDKFKAFLNSK